VVRTGTPIEEVLHDAERGDPRWGRIAGFGLAGGERAEADAYVLAVPAWQLPRMLPPALRETGWFERIAELPTSPAISVQLWLDRDAVGTGDFTLLSGAPVPVYQDQTTNAYPWERGSRVSLILSPADDLLAKPDAELVTLALRALRASEPRARLANVVKSVVLRHPQHLIRPGPGVMSRRPRQAAPVPNLFLAGDWTRQAFFGSQEGAVRGGKAAAAEVVKAFRPGLRVRWLAEAEQLGAS
jgi:15-cis-phytoene desaturase